MGKINYARVFLGGLLAGVVINIAEAVHGMLMQGEWQAAMQALGLRTEPIPTQMVVYPVLSLLIGIAGVWFYAVARPRFGPGPKTAICIGLVLGILIYVVSGIAWGMMIGFPARLLVIGCAWGVVELVIATLVGAWVYKEA